MEFINVKKIIGQLLLLSVVLLAPSAIRSARAADNGRSPELPPVCSQIAVPQGNKPLFHTYALGVQIYRWDGVRWNFVAPEAKLFADANYRGMVGSHYAGPTWESNSGSSVVATRDDGCTPDPTAIPWLRLRMVSTDGNGIFSRTTYILRTNTAGGTAPALPGTAVGEERMVPYTAEYYFYRAEN